MTEAVQALAWAALDRRLDRSSPAPLAVAVSGGGDSMALMHLAAEWAREARRPLRVLTVDHGLNPESGAWAQAAEDSAGRLGLEHRTLCWEGGKPLTGLPAAARRARHALLAGAARAAGARVLLMGHTADDVFEAGRMRAAGSSVGDPREWAPSPAWPEGRGVFVLRPLLDVGREDLRDLLRGMGEGWVEDPANSDPRYARARARLDPAAPSSRRLDQSAPPSHRLGEGTRWGGIELGSDEARAPSVLSAALLSAAGGDTPPARQRVERLAERLGEGPCRATLAGARVVSDGDRILIGREPGRSGLPTAPATPGGEQVWDGRFAITPAEVGTIAPLAGRAARLSKAERAALRGAPAWVRPTLPVLEAPSGAVRLLAEARPLAPERFQAACGVYNREAVLPPV